MEVVVNHILQVFSWVLLAKFLLKLRNFGGTTNTVVVTDVACKFSSTASVEGSSRSVGRFAVVVPSVAFARAIDNLLAGVSTKASVMTTGNVLVGVSIGASVWAACRFSAAKSMSGRARH